MRGTLRAGVALALTGLGAGLAPAIAGAAPPACTPVLAPVDEAVLTGLINAERRAEGIPKVVRQAELQRQGRKKSVAMARGGSFSHSGAMSWAQGRPGAQNIAMAPSAIDAFQAMLNSPAHRQNMLSPDYRLTGVGAARDCTGQIYFTVNLAAPAPR
jgi:uncharacterized protein YkwD